MDGSGNQGETVTHMLSAGTILVWVVGAGKAAEMATIADGLALGSWSITPIGLQGRACYFDVVLTSETSELEVFLAFGAPPRVY